MTSPSRQQVRWLIKPVWFCACLMPFVWMNLQAFAVVSSSLGDDPIAATQDYMGIWALRLLLLTLCISPLRKLTGQLWLLRLRRMTGLFALFYAFMHFLNYVGADKQLEWAAILEDILERPFIVLGALAFTWLLVLGATSTAGWQRRLGRRWQSLHKLVYPAAALVIIHFWWQADGSLAEPAIYCLITAVLLGYRLPRRPISAQVSGRL